MTMASSQDTEITLGTGKVVAIFFGLVALCAVFFAFGFKVGKASVVALPARPGAASAVLGGARPSAAKSSPGNPSAGTSQTDSAPRAAAKEGASQESAADVAASGGQDVGPSNGGYYVQVAAVSKQEDAEALVDSLKRKQYPALATSTGDKLFHVQVGPFSDIKDAEATRAKLVSDGYNPILKK
jgi:DedD protein